jgi:hypothetical protein
MAPISVNLQDENDDRFVFHVEVREADSKSDHVVTLNKTDLERLSGGERSANKLIEDSFRFLLEREPKESILPRFNLTEISKYFPEFEQEIKQQ